jgi:hypothetical protein
MRTYAEKQTVTAEMTVTEKTEKSFQEGGHKSFVGNFFLLGMFGDLANRKMSF